MEKVRVGKMVFMRERADEKWAFKQHDSISQAKKANGLNQRTAAKAPADPVAQVPA